MVGLCASLFEASRCGGRRCRRPPSREGPDDTMLLSSWLREPPEEASVGGTLPTVLTLTGRLSGSGVQYRSWNSGFPVQPIFADKRWQQHFRFITGQSNFGRFVHVQIQLNTVKRRPTNCDRWTARTYIVTQENGVRMQRYGPPCHAVLVAVSTPVVALVLGSSTGGVCDDLETTLLVVGSGGVASHRGRRIQR